MTIKEIMQIVLPDVTYDTAYPHEWGQQMLALGIKPEELRDYVWIYAKGDHFGKPFNYMAAYGRLLASKDIELSEEENNDGLIWCVTNVDSNQHLNVKAKNKQQAIAIAHRRLKSGSVNEYTCTKLF